MKKKLNQFLVQHVLIGRIRYTVEVETLNFIVPGFPSSEAIPFFTIFTYNPDSNELLLWNELLIVETLFQRE